MNIKLEGVSRTVHTHKHKVESARWTRRQDLKMFGTVQTLALSGDFDIEFTFSQEEEISGMKKLIELQPEKALIALGKLHAEAIIELNKSGSINLPYRLTALR